MKTGSNNIDQLFKDSLSNFEADVNPSAWENIEKGLQSPPVRVFKNVKVKNIISFLVLSGAAILTILYFTGKKSETPLTPSDVKTVQQNHTQTNAIGDRKAMPSPGLSSTIKTENSTVEGKQNSKIEDQKTSKVQRSISDADRSKEKESSAQQSSTQTTTKDLKDNAIHQDKSVPVVKNISGSPENLSLSKTSESDHDVSLAIPSGEEVSNGQQDASPLVDTDNNFAFYIPEAFSPNGDGVNDYFIPMGLNFKDYELKIYDRLGIEVFSSKDIVNSWDGKLSNGKEVPPGIYLYVINVKDLSNKNHPYKGKITLRQ